jgi:hypothetical protein
LSNQLALFAVADDGKTAASIYWRPKSGENVILLWDVGTGKEILRRTCPSGLHSGRLSADLKLVATEESAGPDRTRSLPQTAKVGGEPQFRRVAIYELATGRQVVALPPTQGVRYGVFSPDGACLATTSYGIVDREVGDYEKDHTLHLWELATGNACWSTTIPEAGNLAEFSYLAFSRNGRTLATTRKDRVIQLWDVATGQELMRHAGADAEIYCLAFSPDGKTLATGHADSTVLIWDVAAATQRTPPKRNITEKEQQSLWAELAGADARKAHAAIWTLVAAPEQAVALLRGRLHPIDGIAADRMRGLLADLDSDQFDARERAAKQLTEFEELAEPALRGALKANPSLEKRRRIELLLSTPKTVRSPETLRHLRAIQVLEQVGNGDARQVLEKLASGAPESRVTEAARGALTRLEGRRN